MKIANRICRTQSPDRWIGGAMFHNNDTAFAFEQGRIPARTSAMYQAAKRFAGSDRFDPNVSIYSCHIENGRWQFVAGGKKFQ